MSAEETFVKSLEEFEPFLAEMKFVKVSFKENGFSRFVSFKREATTIEFLFGPPEWHVEIVITTAKGRYSFSDRVPLPGVTEWIKNNVSAPDDKNFLPGKENYIKAEILWFINLLRHVLPSLE